MSIVEKVVSRDDKRNRSSQRADAFSSNVRIQNVASDRRSPSNIIELSKLTESRLISVFEDPDLYRAFRFIKRAVLAKIFNPARTGERRPGAVIMITSAMPGAGKSSVAFNLAASIAQEQLISVVLIDADTVRHNLSTIFGLRDSEGLLEILATRNLDNRVVPTDLPSLRFIPAGQIHHNATELLASVHMSEVLATFTEADTVVVVDTTPLLVSNEADAMSAYADQTIVVVEAGNTSVDEIESALQVLQKSGSSISFIINKLKSLSQNGAPDYYYEVY